MKRVIAAGQPAKRPEWETAFIQRVSRMVERDKNRACVILWSLGNEAGYGRNHDIVSAWLRSRDPSRPVHYHPAGNRASVDVLAPMYPSLAELDRLDTTPNDDRPIVMCEYAHSMGNSTGNLAEYWELIRSRSRLQGGFIWDWADQGLAATTEDGIEVPPVVPAPASPPAPCPTREGAVAALRSAFGESAVPRGG